ncbi:ATP-binding cassette domain-containing protein [Streptomyces sp. IB201691-2A2]|nr:ATP-binding cassette domain-containing protein [Streptomyces sp. IB201691-2A2]
MYALLVTQPSSDLPTSGGQEAQSSVPSKLAHSPRSAPAFPLNPDAHIRVRGLARHFQQGGRKGAVVQAVQGIDIDVSRGEILGFLGPNGAGKTTTLRMLTTLLKPTAGHALIAGHDLIKEPREIRRRIGYVAQASGSSPESTVGEELRLQARIYGLPRTSAASRSRELLSQFDLLSLENRLTRTLSGGQRRRLDIALGLVHTPEIIFLDEPTSGLDPQSRMNLWGHIRRMRTEHGMTIFLTTHYLDEVDSLCDRILIMDGGQIIAQGTAESLKAQVSGDVLEVQFEYEHQMPAVAIAGQLAGMHNLSVSDGAIRMRVPRGDMALPDLLRLFNDAGIATIALRVNRPSLDDVFLTLTGRSLREEE